jgi:hypothetical protein
LILPNGDYWRIGHLRQSEVNGAHIAIALDDPEKLSNRVSHYRVIIDTFNYVR